MHLYVREDGFDPFADARTRTASLQVHPFLQRLAAGTIFGLTEQSPRSARSLEF